MRTCKNAMRQLRMSLNPYLAAGGANNVHGGMRDQCNDRGLIRPYWLVVACVRSPGVNGRVSDFCTHKMTTWYDTKLRRNEFTETTLNNERIENG
jgi:hypothetical protein